MTTKILSGRVALVTGASSGIGEATARALANAGAKIALAARRKERLETLANDIRKSGNEVLVLAADLVQEQENRRIVAETEAHFGQLDILVNNAGVMHLAPIDEADSADWRRMLELNVLALMVSSQAALPGMRKRRSGHIVNISSTAGRISNANASGYAATKFGVVAFSEALRKEVYKDNIRVSVIEPGAVDTELREHIPHAATKQALDSWAGAMRQLQGEDIANAVVYCVSQPDHVNVNEILIRPTDQER
jgi:NADP-dependent 3-hydroxy acid dehydrogenase YdfG